ncbi:tetratricopeptide repeat protein [Shewanella salipaludis]|uniref:Tetratricopeptide repeat protein n=1 Tax=Shewanella salipaludis TaxID=2723052 RepID=A0A972FZB0_9GAMM|nr:tetratricopeptide repeat protein [Shewanella salipaludis]NMH64636.1 tetratricopeptide repeat protein [Shewanella salipaludis]
MHPISIIMFALLLLFSKAGLSQDFESEEIQLRESPQVFYDKLYRVVGFPVRFSNRAEFEQTAQELGYSPAALLHNLQQLARLNLESGVAGANKYDDAHSLITQLGAIAQTDYEHAMVAMLNGRYLGRTRQDYQQAITRYNRALALLENTQGIEVKLLKYTIQEHLGTLHLLLRQDIPALVHLNSHRDIAYQLRNNYLIAAAEATLGKYYGKHQQLNKSLQQYSEAFRLVSQGDFPALKAHLQLQLAKVYRDLKQWDEALENAHAAATGFEDLGNTAYLSSCMTVIAMTYGEQGLWNRAIDYYLNAQQIDAKRGNYTAQGLNFHNLGEAYSKIGDNDNALAYLLKANKIFHDKQSQHYLVYNELLIAEVGQNRREWPLMSEHADKALTLAETLKLQDEQIEALRLKATAAREVKDLPAAIAAMDAILELTEQRLSRPSLKTDYNPSLLTEQKLKLDLSASQGKLVRLQASQNRTTSFLILSLLSTLILGLVTALLWRKRQGLAQLNQSLIQTQLKDAMTGHAGYPGLIQALEQRGGREPAVIALLCLPAAIDADLTLGQDASIQQQLLRVRGLSQALNAQTYILRPGLLAIYLSRDLDSDSLCHKIRASLDQHEAGSHFSLGLIRLPLLANPDIKLSAALQFETLQLALAGAMSLGQEQDNWVSLNPLDFVPSTLFAAPLYLHLTKAIERGLIRVETNGHKEQILWPEWKPQQDQEQLVKL